jgi:hypothetical protein
MTLEEEQAKITGWAYSDEVTYEMLNSNRSVTLAPGKAGRDEVRAGSLRQSGFAVTF